MTSSRHRRRSVPPDVEGRVDELLVRALERADVGALDDAEALFREALAVADEHPTDTDAARLRVRALTGLADILRRQRRLPAALARYEEALKVAEAALTDR